MHRTFLIPNLSIKRRVGLLAVLAVFFWLTACRSPQVTGGDISVSIIADGKTQSITLPAGSTVTQALQAAGIIIGSIDKAEPPLYTVLVDADTVTLVRVEEKFETEEVVIPFERQVVRNESLPDGETRLVQAGVNGLQELTYRVVIEDGEEISRSTVKSVSLREAAPEIMMVGAQSSFAPLPIPGTIAYLAGGNAWIIDTSTANRTPVVTTGDLDGRIFSFHLMADTWCIPANPPSRQTRRSIPSGLFVRTVEHLSAQGSQMSSTPQNGFPVRTRSRTPLSSRVLPHRVGRQTMTCSATALQLEQKQGFWSRAAAVCMAGGV